ncbi:hypothetical protein [Microbacterium testaceum]|uniref:hypothetical protein n=1 Tax=Microbacterium testaceum TaxID=2033 RepID=UPI002AC5F2AC|nr:hypothetical protein [Microbacterium testaceum]MDZ5146314.1 hypothetical protein [Microbacterium testaceum]
MADAPLSAQDLVRLLRGRGISTAELAAELHRSPRMVRAILNGETSGALYRETLEELANTGRATKVPPRRRLKDGSLVPVRGRVSQGQGKVVVPDDPGGRYTTDRQGGRAQISTSYMAEGGRIVEARIPKGKTAKGRQEAGKRLVDMIRSAAKGQSRDKQKQITARVTFSNGRQMEVNTYNASTMLKRINDDDSGILTWLASEAGNRYVNLDTTEVPITGVQLNIVETPKTDEYERQGRTGRQRRTRALSDAEKLRQQQRAALEAAKKRRGGRGAPS